MAKVLVMAGYADSLVNFREEMLCAMVENGHEVMACAPGNSPEVEQALFDIGVAYYPIALNRTGLNPILDLMSIYRLTVLFRKLKPDVVLAYTIKPVIYGSIAVRLANVKRIYSMITGLGYAFTGSSFKSRLVGSLAGKLYQLALGFNQRVFFQNPDDRDLFIEKRILKDSIKTILINGSGVNLDVYQSIEIPSSISFLLIARLLRDKGIYEYASAARIIKKEYPQVKFYLAGWLDDNPAAINKDDLQVWQDTGDIEYLGCLPDVRPALADCSVYVLPSYREGTPRTVLEAMATGRAIITTDVPGCRETVDHDKNGVLVPVKDVEALVEAMRLFIEKPLLINTMGKASRQMTEQKYDVHKVNTMILETMGLK